MEITGIIQARMDSTRLSGKVLAEIEGRPALGIQIERLRRCRHLDRLLIVTTTTPQNDSIERLAEEYGLSCFRGSEEDVLDRYYQAAGFYHVEHICRLTGDCPLIDPKTVDRLAACYKEHFGKYVYVASGETYPEGSSSAEFFPFSIIRQAWREAKSPVEREHVTYFIRKRPERFPRYLLENEVDLGKYRITLDEPQDLEVLRKIVSCLGYGAEVDIKMIATFLAGHPEIHGINCNIMRNEGLVRSMKKLNGETNLNVGQG